MAIDFEIKFYGVRGTYPVSDKNMIKYGGNTPCVYMKVAGKNFIFDAGTGIIKLGEEVNTKEFDANIFITHMHHDHIQGLSFLKPLFLDENSNIKIYCKNYKEATFESIIKAFLHEPLFPYNIDTSKAKHEFEPIESGDIIEFGDIKVYTIQNNHPDGGLGYKVTYNNKSCCYITDYEVKEENIDELTNFIKGTDILIMDATYNKEEYKEKEGWGHSTWEDVTHIAKDAKVKKLFLFHHKPTRTDRELNEIQKNARKILKNTFCAKEDERVVL
ncbi:MAG TPA: MBL fold metallo-hydrolase [Clostridiales bacterium]|nr:MAG: hypothetical protein A2Y18_01980 [Clostridiales bacterium GWD2_32_19]HCC07473.1 MBL fold metallo-hydrolase [Clostridiales bacterium]